MVLRVLWLKFKFKMQNCVLIAFCILNRSPWKATGQDFVLVLRASMNIQIGMNRNSRSLRLQLQLNYFQDGHRHAWWSSGNPIS